MPWNPGELAPDPGLTRSFTACLPGGRLAGPLRAYHSVPSTQTLARTWAEAGAPAGAVVLADHQTAGRGRRGRAWTALPGRALLFSVVLRPCLPPARWPEIALAAGCAVAEGIESVAGVAPQLKWPNDVLLGGRKVAGILAEGVVGRTPVVILGVGVNVSQPDGAWPPELHDRATALAAVAPAVTRPLLLAAILRRIETWHGILLDEGFGPVRTAWRARGRLGDRVRLGVEEAVAVDLAPDGGLVVRRDDGTSAVILCRDDGDSGPGPVPAVSAQKA